MSVILIEQKVDVCGCTLLLLGVLLLILNEILVVFRDPNVPKSLTILRSSFSIAQRRAMKLEELTEKEARRMKLLIAKHKD